MTENERIAIVDHAVRWASNILVEVQGNHGRSLSHRRSRLLHEATAALAEFMGPDEPAAVKPSRKGK